MAMNENLSANTIIKKKFISDNAIKIVNTNKQTLISLLTHIIISNKENWNLGISNTFLEWEYDHKEYNNIDDVYKLYVHISGMPLDHFYTFLKIMIDENNMLIGICPSDYACERTVDEKYSKFISLCNKLTEYFNAYKNMYFCDPLKSKDIIKNSMFYEYCCYNDHHSEFIKTVKTLYENSVEVEKTYKIQRSK